MLAALMYGPDHGLIRERANQIIASILGTPYDPMNLTELTEEKIKSDPVILRDEICAMSLLGGGGARVVYVRDASDKIASVFDELFDESLNPSAFLVVASDDLPSSSSLRKWAETSPKVACLACYHDEGRSLETVISDYLSKSGIRASQDVIQFLAEHSGNDRYITMQELDKIILFQGKDTYLTLDNAVRLIGQNDFFTLDDLSMSVASGDYSGIESYLQRLLLEGIQPVVIIRSLQRYFQRLESVASRIADGQNIESAMAQLRPPVFFKFAPVFRRHVSRWSHVSLSHALGLMLKTERELKTTGNPAGLLLSRALIRIARLPNVRSKAA